MEDELDEEFRGIIFRNYIPRDEKLKRLYKSTIEDYNTIEAMINEQIDEIINDYESEDVLSLVRPRRQNWDLKRELNRKREILSARTDTAILKLLHESKNGNEVLLQQMAHTMAEESDTINIE